MKGCEQFSHLDQSSQRDRNSVHTHRILSVFRYFSLSPLGMLLSLVAAAPALSNLALLAQESQQSDVIPALPETGDRIGDAVQQSSQGRMPAPPTSDAMRQPEWSPTLGAAVLLSPESAAPACWKPESACVMTQLSGRSAQPEVPSEDGELGELRLRDVPETMPDGGSDPELGTLRLEELPQEPPFENLPAAIVQPPRQPSVYLLGRLDYFRSSNVFTEFDPVNDGLLRAGISLFYAPALGPKTFLVAGLDVNSVRYDKLGAQTNLIPNGRRVGSLNYDELRLRLGLYQRLDSRMAAEIGWSNQQLFQSREGLTQFFGGERFFNDNTLRLELTRQDPFGKRWSLNTFYQFRWSFAPPTSPTDISRDRLVNTAIASLNYNWSPTFQTGIDYQYAWTHYTQIARNDNYHQVIGRITYTITPRTQLNLFSGYSFGNSTDTRINFSGFIFGAGFVVNTPLF
jgi:hypothetical protein